MLDQRVPVRVSTRRVTAAALAIWATLVVVAFVWGRVLVSTHHDLLLRAPPFWSPWHWHPGRRMLPAFVVAGLALRYGPDLARRLSWRAVLATVAATNAVWAVAMAWIDGPRALTDPLDGRHFDYLQTASTRVHSLPQFLAHFVDRLPSYNQHTIGHPPGLVVIEWVMLRAHLATPESNAVLMLAGGVASGIAALVAMREVAGEARARAAAPFLALVPAVIWWQTADAFFAGVSATAVALVVVASGRIGRRADGLALAGGLLFGLTLFLSYGLAPLALIPIAVCRARRTVRPLVVSILGVIPWFVAFAAAGFSWFAGFAATRHLYWIGAASQRPYRYFLVADLAVFALATGPAVAVGLARLRDPRTWLLVGGGLAVVALADLSGMSKGEVERIWLPFVPWAMLAAGAVVEDLRATRVMRTWLTWQIACTMLLAVTIWSQW